MLLKKQKAFFCISISLFCFISIAAFSSAKGQIIYESASPLSKIGDLTIVDKNGKIGIVEQQGRRSYPSGV